MALVKNLAVAVASAGFMALAAASQANAASVSLEYDTSIGRPANLAEGEFPGVPGTLAAPQGVAVQESTGNIFVANGRGIDTVDIFDSQGNYLREIGGTGTGLGQFDEPAAIAFEPGTGKLYVGDVFNNRVNVFNSDGSFDKSILEGQFGGLIEGRAFFGPSGITFDKDGFGYIGDFSGDRILKFNSDGNLVSTIGGVTGTEPGQLQGPAALAILSDGNFAVTDQFNNRIQVITPTGEPVKVFGGPGSEPGQFIQPIDIEVDQFDNIFVTDSVNSRVQVFDKDGNFLTAFGEPARNAAGEVAQIPQIGGPTPYGDPLVLEPGVFNWTAGSDLKDGKLYVGDFFQGRVQVLDVSYGDSTEVPEPTSLLGLTVLGAGAAALKLRKQRQQKLASQVVE